MLWLGSSSGSRMLGRLGSWSHVLSTSFVEKLRESEKTTVWSPRSNCQVAKCGDEDEYRPDSGRIRGCFYNQVFDEWDLLSKSTMITCTTFDDQNSTVLGHHTSHRLDWMALAISPSVLPSVHYPQGEQRLCTVCSLASACRYMGYSDLEAHLVATMQPMAVTSIASLVSRSRLSYRARKETSTMSVAEFVARVSHQSHHHDTIVVCLLRDADGSQQHAVSIASGFIFDSEQDHAVPLSIENLVSCTGTVPCVAVTRSAWIVPRNRVPRNRRGGRKHRHQKRERE